MGLKDWAKRKALEAQIKAQQQTDPQSALEELMEGKVKRLRSKGIPVTKENLAKGYNKMLGLLGISQAMMEEAAERYANDESK